VLAVAAAAAVALLVAFRTPRPAQLPAPGRPAPARTVASLPPEETTDTADVADLDGAALQRLVERLRAGERGASVALVGSEDSEVVDVPVYEETQMNDELAELDTSALLRVERSLAGASL
jgi:hypothetical protein